MSRPAAGSVTTSTACRKSYKLRAWCDTRVDLSLDNVGQVKSVARAVLPFGSTLGAFIPADCPKSELYMRSHQLRAWQGDRRVYRTGRRGEAQHVAVAKLMKSPGRCSVWNFQNLYKGHPLTIVFGQGPGVTLPTDPLAWAEFAVMFTSAVNHQGGRVVQTSPEVHHRYRWPEDLPEERGGDAVALARITGGTGTFSAKIDGTTPMPSDKDADREEVLEEGKLNDGVRKEVFVKKVEEDKKAVLAALAAVEGEGQN